jgi:hypothetical protein
MDYYMTWEDSDGRTTGPTRLLGIYDDKAAMQALRQQSHSCPQSKITIEARATEDDIGKVVKRCSIEPETKRCPRCKRFVGKGQKCSKCLE